MADTISRARRRQIMSSVKGANTKPEMAVRRLLHAMGHRYALHKRDLPGRPDICLVARRRVIFVNGCFWHQHASKTCWRSRIPKSNTRFWTAKLERNAQRDKANIRLLRRQGWKVLVVWECQIGQTEQLKNRLERFLHD